MSQGLRQLVGVGVDGGKEAAVAAVPGDEVETRNL